MGLDWEPGVGGQERLVPGVPVRPGLGLGC